VSDVKLQEVCALPSGVGPFQWFCPYAELACCRAAYAEAPWSTIVAAWLQTLKGLHLIQSAILHSVPPLIHRVNATSRHTHTGDQHMRNNLGRHA
jgi:hypothetical protein